MFETLKRYDIKVIQLIRRDLLEQAIWYRSEGRRHIEEYEKIGLLGAPYELKENEKVTVRIGPVISFMKKTYNYINEYRRKADLTVYYEEVTGNKNRWCFYDKKVRKKVLEFLGVEDLSLRVNQEVNRKNIRPPNEVCIRNWKELLQEIKKQKVITYYEDGSGRGKS